MTINSISNTAIRLQPLNQTLTQRINTESQTSSSAKSVNQNSSLSPLSSRYTYAIGRDGKRYILQLRIDIASVRAFSALA